MREGDTSDGSARLLASRRGAESEEAGAASRMGNRSSRSKEIMVMSLHITAAPRSRGLTE